MNPYEAAAREKKVAAIVRWLDAEIATRADLPPMTSQQIARFVEALSPQMWADMGRHAGVRVPSETTRAAVVRFLRRRIDRTTEPELEF